MGPAMVSCSLDPAIVSEQFQGHGSARPPTPVMEPEISGIFLDLGAAPVDGTCLRLIPGTELTGYSLSGSESYLTTLVAGIGLGLAAFWPLPLLS